MGMLRGIFLRNNDGTVVDAAASSAAYTAWLAKNATGGTDIKNSQYCLAKMAKYYKILKREGAIPIA